MSSRQRRGLVLVVVSVVAATVVFFGVAAYIAEIQSRVGPLTAVVRVERDIAAHEPIPGDALATVELPRRWAPERAIGDIDSVADLRSPMPLRAGTVLQEGMVAPAPELTDGEREVALWVDAETSVAGKVTPGMVVDIYATFNGGDALPPWTAIVVDEARVIEVGVPRTDQLEQADGELREGRTVPVTFALSIADSLRVTHIDAFAQSVRLALRTPTDNGAIDDEQRIYQPFPPQNGR